MSDRMNVRRGPARLAEVALLVSLIGMVVVAALIFLGPVTDVSPSHPHCMTHLTNTPDDPCPTPAPFPGTRYGPLGAIAPSPEVAPLCVAFGIVFDRVRPAINSLGDPVFAADPASAGAAGRSIMAATSEIQRLAANHHDPEIASALRGLASAFAEDAQRASSGDISDTRARHLFVDLVTQYGRDCYAPTPGNEDLRRARLAGRLAEALVLPATTVERFDDDDDSPYEPAIDRVVAAGLMTGCGPARFCPDEVVGRGEMADILVRAFDLSPTETDYFVDDAGSPFEDAINRAVAAGLLSGHRSGTFDSGAAMTPRQLDSILRRALAP